MHSDRRSGNAYFGLMKLLWMLAVAQLAGCAGSPTEVDETSSPIAHSASTQGDLADGQIIDEFADDEPTEEELADDAERPLDALADTQKAGASFARTNAEQDDEAREAHEFNITGNRQDYERAVAWLRARISAHPLDNTTSFQGNEADNLHTSDLVLHADGRRRATLVFRNSNGYLLGYIHHRRGGDVFHHFADAAITRPEGFTGQVERLPYRGTYAAMIEAAGNQTRENAEIDHWAQRRSVYHLESLGHRNHALVAQALLRFTLVFAEAARFYPIETRVSDRYDDNGAHLTHDDVRLTYGGQWRELSTWMRRAHAGRNPPSNHIPQTHWTIQNMQQMAAVLAVILWTENTKPRGPHGLLRGADEQVASLGETSEQLEASRSADGWTAEEGFDTEDALAAFQTWDESAAERRAALRKQFNEVIADIKALMAHIANVEGSGQGGSNVLDLKRSLERKKHYCEGVAEALLTQLVGQAKEQHEVLKKEREYCY
jgi:hypothetical protein